MTKLFAAILAAAGICLPTLSYGAFLSTKEKGTTSAQFLRLPAGARAAAMGEAFTASANNALALYWNPAGLNSMSAPRSVHFMHAFYVETISFGYLGYAMRLPGNWGNAGAGVQYLNAGSIDRTDENGNSLGSYAPKDQAVILGWAKTLLGLPAGLSFKSISSKITTSASTWALDLGVQMPHKLLNDKLDLALTAKNIGPGLEFRQERNPLPFEMRFGASYNMYDNLSGQDILAFAERITVNADLILPSDNQPGLAIGLEHTKIFGSPVSGWAGFNSRAAGEISGLAGFSLGFGVNIKNSSIQYAIIPMGNLGFTHRVSLEYEF